MGAADAGVFAHDRCATCQGCEQKFDDCGGANNAIRQRATNPQAWHVCVRSRDIWDGTRPVHDLDRDPSGDQACRDLACGLDRAHART